jgi:hypothetical protein
MELIILLGLIFVIIVSHTLCGCSKVGLLEGLETITSAVKEEVPIKKKTENNNDNNSIPSSMMTGGGKSVGGTSTEGFTSSSMLYVDEPAQYKLGDYSQVDTSSWIQPNLEVRPGQPLGEGVRQFMARQEQPVPLPEGEMLMFANTPFKPECCPSTYSNSSGCACMTGKQYNYLIQRGSNNVPYSDF